jgi:hypothetical protein
MDDDKLIERLEEGVREAEDLLHRRKDALAALKGKAGTGKKGSRVRGLRPGSIPALALAALKLYKQPLSIEDLTAHLKKTNASLDTRKVGLALGRYVRLGQHFTVDEAGSYSLK